MPDADTMYMGPNHEHWWISGNAYCGGCGMGITEMRQEARDNRMIEAFNRLADVLERLETRLAERG